MLILAVLSSATALPASHEAIALRVAGDGIPACRSYYPDGSESPCLPRFSQRGGGAVNGQSRGAAITFTRGAVTRLGPDAFALLAGHEIAHTYLRHHGATAEDERAADRLGALLACRAGFDPARGLALFRHLHADRTHDSPRQRMAAVLGVLPPAGCAADPAPNLTKFTGFIAPEN